MNLVTLRWGFLYIVWPSVLSLKNIKLHKTKAVRYICIQEKIIIKVTFDPGLALTSFQTTIENRLTWHKPAIQPKNSTWSAVTLKKKHVTLISSKIEPAIWSCDTGQRMPCFDRCHLTITWMSNIKEVHYNPRLHVSVNLIAVVWAPSCMTVVVVVIVIVVQTHSWAKPLAMITIRKSMPGFPLLSFLGMGLLLVALQATGALLIYH